jgi:hypothetical protein
LPLRSPRQGVSLGWHSQHTVIIAGGDGKAAKPVKVPGYGTVRLYVLAPGIIGDVEGNDAG